MIDFIVRTLEKFHGVFARAQNAFYEITEKIEKVYLAGLFSVHRKVNNLGNQPFTLSTLYVFEYLQCFFVWQPF